MISPHIGSDKLLEIKTNAFHVVIKRRKAPSLSSDIISKQKSTLEICGDIREVKINDELRNDSLNKSYFKVDIAPLFFEQSDYIVNVKSLNGEPVRFEHPDKRIKETLSATLDDSSILNGTINFGSEVGYSKLVFTDTSKNSLLIQIEIFPSKLTYKEDYEAIRNDINEMVEAVAIDFINSTYALGTAGASGNTIPAIYFYLINQLFDKFYKSISVIMSRPNHRLVTEHTDLPPHKIKKIDSKFFNWLYKHSHNIKKENERLKLKSALAVKKRMTYDTVENRLVKHMLSTTVKRLYSFKRTYISSFRDPQKSADKDVLKRIDAMSSKIENHLNNPVFGEVSDIGNTNTMSLVFQTAPGYREMYRLFKLMQKGISFTGEVFAFSMKDTATLYEYWCFIKLVNIMKSKYALLNKSDDIIKANNNGITVTLSKDSKSEVKFLDTQTGDKFTLIYNPGKLESLTSNQIPDNILSLEKSTIRGKEKEKYQYIFDAKYKIEMNPDQYYPDTEPGPKIEDINTMHRYRDAIVSKEGKSYKKSVFGAYILFPYPNSEDEFKKHHFYKSIEAVNIGGVPFLPGKTQIAENLLTDLVSESNTSAFERSLLPKGIDKRLRKIEWEKRDVLVGSLSSKEQWEDLLTRKYYYVPLKSIPSDTPQPRYIAIYQSQNLFGKDAGIFYYGEIINTESKRRKYINRLHDKIGKNEFCYLYKIKEWKTLDVKIEYEEEWVYKPRYTNLFLLNNCSKTFELFNVRSAEDFRLLNELRRIQSDIKTEDNSKEFFIRFNDSVSIYNDSTYIRAFKGNELKFIKRTEEFSGSPASVFKELKLKLVEKINTKE